MLQKHIPGKNRRAQFCIVVLFMLLGAGSLQAAPVTAPTTAAPAQFDDLFKEKTLEAVLAKLQPPATKDQAVKSDYLLLGLPDIALAGQVSVRMMSEIPGTDLFLLFDGAAQPGQPVLLAAKAIPALSKADVNASVTVTNSTQLLLLARANGRIYSVTRDIKVAVKDRK